MPLPKLTVQSFDDVQFAVDQIVNAFNALGIYWGNGSPETVVTAGVGSIYRRLNGGAGTSIYVKESGTGNTGWVAK